MEKFGEFEENEEKIKLIKKKLGKLKYWKFIDKKDIKKGDIIYVTYTPYSQLKYGILFSEIGKVVKVNMDNNKIIIKNVYKQNVNIFKEGFGYFDDGYMIDIKKLDKSE